MSHKVLIKHYQVTTKEHPILMKDKLYNRGFIPDNDFGNQKQDLVTETQASYLVVTFLSISNRKNFGMLVEDMENKYLKITDNYPTNLAF